MDAWLKMHVAKILPSAGALSYPGGHTQQLARNQEALRFMALAIRDGFEVLRAYDIAIIPPDHRLRLWLTEPLIVIIMKRMFSGELGLPSAARLPSDSSDSRAKIQIEMASKLLFLIDSETS